MKTKTKQTLKTDEELRQVREQFFSAYGHNEVLAMWAKDHGKFLIEEVERLREPTYLEFNTSPVDLPEAREIREAREFRRMTQMGLVAIILSFVLNAYLVIRLLST